MAGIYIHMPFCHSKCHYCDFYSLPRLELRSKYVASLIRELEIQLNNPEWNNLKWETIYIGGGTPSLLPKEELLRITETLPLENVNEFTIEANPEDVTPDWVDTVLSAGIDRVSIGIQSLNDSELHNVGRRHTSEQAIEALNCLRSGGIKNISADLIYGLPGQTIESWRRSVTRLMEFNPEHISSYALSYEPGTKLYARRMSGKIAETDEDIIDSMYHYLIAMAEEHGYDHYEISNFGKPDYHSRHNSSYWTFTPYLGIGVAAHGFIGDKRYANPWNINKYNDSINKGNLVAEIETLSVNDVYNEYIMTALRTSKGVSYGRLEELTNKSHLEDFKNKAIPFLKNQSLDITHSGVRIPEDRWLISDAIIRELMIV